MSVAILKYMSSRLLQHFMANLVIFQKLSSLRWLHVLGLSHELAEVLVLCNQQNNKLSANPAAARLIISDEYLYL